MTQVICDFCEQRIAEKPHKIFLENHYPEVCVGRVQGYNVTDVDVCDECYHKYILNNLHTNKPTN